jgi:uncharacterized repeat protein (TIGR02543 family)
MTGTAVTFPITNVTANTTLWAKWTAVTPPPTTYTVTWHADGGTPVPTQTTVTHGNSITAPAAMTKTGYTFDGWFTNAAMTGTAVTFPITNVTANTTLWAKWTAVTITPPPPTTYTVTFNPAGGTRTGGGALNQTVIHGNAATAPIVTRNGYSFNGWDREFSSVTSNMTINARWLQVSTGSDRDSGNDGNGGGGGIRGGGISATPGAPTTSWLEANRATELAAQNQSVVGTTSTGANIYTVRGNAWTNLNNRTYRHDSIVGNAVQVRVSVSNPTLFTKDTLVSGHLVGTDAQRTSSLFRNWFANRLVVIHLDQQEDFEQAVRIAAKVDLTDMDTGNLHFYAYNKITNTYRPIANPTYSIDANGYLWFTTPYGGTIVVSDSVLTRS